MTALVTRTSYLTVNSVPLSTPAYWITNLDDEIRKVKLRGSSTVIPASPGRYANPRILDEYLCQFQMFVTGNYANDGTPASNYRTQLDTNCDYLIANLGLGSTSGDGTVTATWTRVSGTKSASVTLESLTFGDVGKRHLSAVLEMSVPAGAFA